MIERKIDNKGKINISRQHQGKANINLDTSLGVKLYADCFTVEKFDSTQNYIAMLEIEHYNKLTIPSYIMDTLKLNFGDTLYVNCRNNKIIYGKTIDSVYASLTEQEKQNDFIIESAYQAYVETAEGHNHLFNTFVQIVKKSTPQKLSEFFEIDITQFEYLKTVEDRAKLIFTNEMKKLNKELLI